MLWIDGCESRCHQRRAAAPGWEIRCSSLREVGAASDPKKLRALLAVVRSRLVNGRHGHFVSLNLRCPFDYFRQDSLYIWIGCAVVRLGILFLFP